MKKENTFKKILNSFKSLFVRLFGNRKKQIDILEEEALMSPTRIIIKKFFNSKLAVIGLIGLLLMLICTFVMSLIIPYDELYFEGTQANLPPNTSYLKYPSKLEKEGIRLLTSGNSFSIAISKENNVYAWGTNIFNIRDDAVSKWQEYAPYIIDIAAGTQHALALVEKPVQHVWRNYVVLQFSEYLDLFEATDGSRWFFGNSDPDDDLGKTDDFFLNPETKQLFKKEEEGWRKDTNLTGLTEFQLNDKTIYIGENSPSDDFGLDGQYYFDMSNNKAWIIYEKMEQSVEQELLFLGYNHHNQAQIPEFVRGEDGSIITETAVPIKYRLEREAIARYFDSDFFDY